MVFSFIGRAGTFPKAHYLHMVSRRVDCGSSPGQEPAVVYPLNTAPADQRGFFILDL